jgi:LytTr DNA-binding domain-containing protein
MKSATQIFGRVYARVALILVIWTAYGLFFGTQGFLRAMSSGKTASLSSYIVIWILCGYSWALLTVPLLKFVDRFSLERLGWAWFLLVHIPVAPAVGSLALALYVVLANTLFFGLGRSITDFYLGIYLDEIQSETLVYLMIVGVVTVCQGLFHRDPDRELIHRSPADEHSTAIDDLSKGIGTNGHANSPINDRGANAHANGNGYVRRISIKDNGRITLVDADTIKWISSYGNYLKIHTTEGRYIHRETMTAIEKKLDPAHFVRIRRSAIVRIDQIKELYSTENGEFEIILSDGNVLTSTRRYRKNLERVLKS